MARTLDPRPWTLEFDSTPTPLPIPCRVMGEMVIHLIQTALRGLQGPSPLSEDDRVVAAAPLPPPMIPV